MIIENNERFRTYTSPEVFDKLKEYRSVSEMWKHCLSEYADRPAIGDDGKLFTFAQTEERAAQFRGIFSSNGISGNIGLLMPNSFELAAAFLAVSTSGNTAVVLPAQLDAVSVFGCSMKFGLKALIYMPGMEDKLSLIKEKAPALLLIPADASADNASPSVDADADDSCVIMFTGGTTGKSKAVLLSHGAVMQGVVNGCYGYEDVFYQRYLLVLPLSHIFGLVRNLLTSLYTGSTIYICRNTKDMFRDIEQYRPTILVLVPALAEMALMLSKKFGKNMLGEDMKYIICGAAAVAPYLAEEYAKLGITLFPGYGLTETANLVSGNPEPLKKPDSVGIPYAHQELRIENGELLIKGANMMMDYVGEETDGRDNDGWFHTGDLARFDDDGFLYITGRIKELIVLSNGENVSPAEVEAHFNELALVQDSQVFEDVNENGVHILALEVVPRATEMAALKAKDPSADAAEVLMSELTRINRSLPSFQRVSRIVIRDTDFERTPSMKIVRYHKCS